ncbi:MAG: hypothetical protein DME04_09400 [Candidatus Rokuibacteriota bacterium]|nr:MAG: hypothetical protein DME04_09400 [Candidatus Rokubacteria bacterium]
MGTRLVSLFAALALGFGAAGPASAQPLLVPAVLTDGAGELIRVFEEVKDAAEKVDPPEISLGPAFEPQPEYR